MFSWTIGGYATIVLGGSAFPQFMPRALPIAAAVVIAAAVLGAIAAKASTRVVVRSALLVASAFSAPVFIGGRILPWAVACATAALVVAGWLASERWGARIIVAQALAIALGIGIGTAAAQFLFPTTAPWISVAAACGFALLVWSSAPNDLEVIPVAMVVAVIIAEGLAVLRALPTHWVTNGALLALAFAAAYGDRRIPRAAYAGLLVLLLGVGVLR